MPFASEIHHPFYEGKEIYIEAEFDERSHDFHIYLCPKEYCVEEADLYIYAPIVVWKLYFGKIRNSKSTFYQNHELFKVDRNKIVVLRILIYHDKYKVRTQASVTFNVLLVFVDASGSGMYCVYNSGWWWWAGVLLSVTIANV